MSTTKSNNPGTRSQSQQNWERPVVEAKAESHAWTPIEDCDLKHGERVMVLTTDAEDDPHHALAHFNGSMGFLGIGGHRVTPVTHYQRLDPPPTDWKLPPQQPSNRKKQRIANQTKAQP